MTFPDRDSPVWPIGTGLLIAITAGLTLWGNYKSVDTRDLTTITELLISYFTIHWAKRIIWNKDQKEPSDESK